MEWSSQSSDQSREYSRHPCNYSFALLGFVFLQRGFLDFGPTSGARLVGDDVGDDAGTNVGADVSLSLGLSVEKAVGCDVGGGVGIKEGAAVALSGLLVGSRLLATEEGSETRDGLLLLRGLRVDFGFTIGAVTGFLVVTSGAWEGSGVLEGRDDGCFGPFADATLTYTAAFSTRHVLTPFICAFQYLVNMWYNERTDDWHQ